MTQPTHSLNCDIPNRKTNKTHILFILEAVTSSGGRDYRKDGVASRWVQAALVELWSLACVLPDIIEEVFDLCASSPLEGD